MKRMGASAIAFGFARHFPAPTRVLVKLLLELTPKEKPLHWVVSELKDRLSVKISRQVSIDGFSMVMDPFDGLSRKLIRQGLSEPGTTKVLEELIAEGMTIVDVGAYVGQFTLLSCRAMKGSGKIIAFAPTREIVKFLRKNIEQNGCSNVSVVKAAVSDQVGLARFFVMPGSADQNSLQPLDGKDAFSYEVAVETIDHYFEQQGLNHLDLMKVDVEGNELFALRGAMRVLREARPYVVVEISRHQSAYGYSGREIQQTLSGVDYDCYRIFDDALLENYRYEPTEIGGAVTHFNLVAIPREKLTTTPLKKLIRMA